MVTAEKLIDRLPAYRDQWITINKNQTVDDIVIEVLDAHEEFAPYYDLIAEFFDGGTVEQICDKINSFLKTYVRYKEESEHKQTSALPTGILVRGYGDCKHYAGFSAGILDALKRRGKKIDWCYRFASYKIIDQQPHHVFTVVKDNQGEIWIDPTPGSLQKTPSWIIDKKVKVSTMALKRNIGNVNTDPYTIFSNMEIVPGGDIVERGRPYWQLMPAEGERGKDGNRGTNPYFSGPFLALEHYKEDPYSIEGTNWQQTADAMNAKIATGPHPGHTFSPDFIKWIYETSNKGWNFYYPGGVQNDYVPNLPSWYPKMIISPDGRLTFDRDYAVDDYMNDEIHALTAWAQSLINQNDPSPYPLKPEAVKIFSQLKAGNLETRNLFTEQRGTPFFKAVANGLKNTVKAIGKGWFKIVGAVPRNAFLSLVGLNVFGYATKLARSIDNGLGDELFRKWKAIGGKPEKLLNTINDGKNKKAILGEVENEAAIGEVAAGVAGFLAAAAPIIAALLKFLDKDGKVTEALSATKAYLEQTHPELDLSAFGFLDRETGQEIQWTVDDIDNENLATYTGPGGYNTGIGAQVMTFAKSNPLLIAAAGAGVTYFLTNGKNKKQNFIIPLAVGAGLYFLISAKSGGLDVSAKAKYLLSVMPDLGPILRQMNPTEITDCYDYITNFVQTNRKDQTPADLKQRIQAIATKYNIFT